MASVASDIVMTTGGSISISKHQHQWRGSQQISLVCVSINGGEKWQRNGVTPAANGVKQWRISWRNQRRNRRRAFISENQWHGGNGNWQ